MPTDDETVAFQVRFPKALDKRLRAEAEGRMIAPQLLVARAVEKFLDELVPLSESLRTVHDAAKQAGYETKPAKGLET